MKRNNVLFISTTLAILLCMTGCQKPSYPAIESTQPTTAIENTVVTEPSDAHDTTLPTDTSSIDPTEESIASTEPTSEQLEEVDNNTEPSNATEFIDQDDENADDDFDVETAPTEVTEPDDVDNNAPDETVAEIVEPDDDELVNIIDYIPNVIIDLKYATEDNFTGEQIYDEDMSAMLRYGTVKKLIEVQTRLNYMGYTLVIWDAYRPTEAQFKLWDICPNSTYVANPNTGFSSHSRGNTVDVTIITLEGDAVAMPTGFDDFSQAANRNYSDVSEEAATNATMLEIIMEDCGFKPYYGEWWHFSDTVKYDVINNT